MCENAQADNFQLEDALIVIYWYCVYVREHTPCLEHKSALILGSTKHTTHKKFSSYLNAFAISTITWNRDSVNISNEDKCLFGVGNQVCTTLETKKRKRFFLPCRLFSSKSGLFLSFSKLCIALETNYILRMIWTTFWLVWYGNEGRTRRKKIGSICYAYT